MTNPTDNDKKKTSTILVVGRFGSGKSTLLNTLAGVHWKVQNGHFVSNTNSQGVKAKEQFATSRAVKGCTVSAVASDITTFDGRELTVIDTVGYDDTVNVENFYNTSNLTDVMDGYDEISAVVVVVNSQDPRLTQGFIESLACVPKSFKKEVQKNIILVFTKWSEDDEEEYGHEVYRGFDEQIKIIRTALGFDDDEMMDEKVDDSTAKDGKDGTIPAYWMDNRPFKSYSGNARRTIGSLSSFLDYVERMPQLSCQEFKEMRALSQFERSVRKAFRQYFHPSDRSPARLSGFENLLFACASKHANNIAKVSLTRLTAKDWSEKLLAKMEPDIMKELPKEIKKICDKVADGLDLTDSSMCGGGHKRDSELSRGDSVGGFVAKGLVRGGFAAIMGTTVISLGGSLMALPGCVALAYLHSKTWSREDVVHRVVFAISEEKGRELCSTVTDRFSSHIDEEAEKLQKWFQQL